MESALMSESDDEAYGAGKGGIVAMTPAGAYPISFNNNWQLSLSKQTKIIGQIHSVLFFGIRNKNNILDARNSYILIHLFLPTAGLMLGLV
jgi:hypothetical protein